MFKKPINRYFSWQPFAIRQLLTALFVLLLAGLLFSRALLSICMAVWCIVIIFFQFKLLFPQVKHALLHWSVMPLVLFVLGA